MKKYIKELRQAIVAAQIKAAYAYHFDEAAYPMRLREVKKLKKQLKSV